MNNEPVAWMHHCLKSGIGYLSYTKPPPLDDYKPIPLYTHPHSDKSVKAKTLTDEEIIEIGNAVTNLIDSNEGWIEFARAILRKAQEK